MVMSGACFWAKTFPNYLNRAPDMAAVRTIFNVFSYDACVEPRFEPFLQLVPYLELRWRDSFHRTDDMSLNLGAVCAAVSSAGQSRWVSARLTKKKKIGQKLDLKTLGTFILRLLVGSNLYCSVKTF